MLKLVIDSMYKPRQLSVIELVSDLQVFEVHHLFDIKN